MATPSRSRTEDRAANPAVRAEPRGVGTARARDPLAREVKLLGALLGQVIVEQEGLEALELVERVRRATIELRRTGGPGPRRRLGRLLDDVDLRGAELLIRSFSLYFQLTNLAEEKQRVRRLRQAGRSASRGAPGSIAAAVDDLARDRRRGSRPHDAVRDLAIGLVLTAHPTEARRRTVLVALRRIYRLLDGLDDPRITTDEDAEARRRLREAITVLWHTAVVRPEPPSPLDEVRAVMTFFDETLFVVAPRLYRALDRALDLTAPSRRGRAETEASRDGGRTGTRPVRAHAFVRWGSWVGGDRDGNPHVTADTSIDAVRIGADHVMRGYEAVVRRLMNTITAAVPPDRLDLRLRQGLARDAELVPEAAADLARRFPSEPYRRRLGAIAERIERTRAWLVDGAPVDPAAYLDPGTLGADLESLAGALSAGGLERVAYGELQDLRWQLETFAFHGFSLEVRQHAGAHSGALAALKDGRPADEVAPGVTADEVAATFRAIGAIQGRFGVAACHRYVISFTRSAQDVVDVLELAALSRPDDGGRPELDVVPLFESADALEGSAAILDALLRDPRYREHLRERGDRQELMLGYSDSTKESGGLAAAWMLYRAQEVLLATAHQHGVEVTLFHGRGGAIGRGGGPMSRAIAAQAPGSLRGRLRLTEQGEVIADRYSNGVIALRHLEQLVNAVLLASTDAHEARSRAAGSRGADVLDELADASRRAYRALVWDDPVFETYFRAATPIDELSGMAMGSRPSARRLGPSWTLASLRAIPWVFAWSQSRANLPGWYGLGTALRAYEQAHGAAGVERLRSLYREWPFFSSVLDNAEMSLAKADLQVARRYAGLAPTVESRRVWRRIRGEFLRTEAAILRVNGRERLLDAAPVLQRSIALRNPYVDSLSELQVRLLARLRAMAPDDPDRERVRRLVQLTVSGVAAGVQNTG